jgi:regulator of sirC expression with transglutaminase-like and TPR domain
MNKSINQLRDSIDKAKVEKELEDLLNEANTFIQNEPLHIDLLELRAMIYKKLQKFGLAINDYRSILLIDKNHKQAQIQTEQLLTILKYQNTDIFESPNTNFDPWLD